MQGVKDGLYKFAEDLQHKIDLFLGRDMPCKLN